MYEPKKGQRFGQLTIIKIKATSHGWMVQCKCDCGGLRWFNACHIMPDTRKYQRCGRSGCKKIGPRKHNMSRTNTYKSWAGMKERCYNRNSKWFHRYGGRGIIVCDRWLNSFENFLADMGEKPVASRISLERINNDGNYEPSNCKWATQKEQTNNTSKSRRLTFDGKTKTVEEWSKKTGIKYFTIIRRIEAGWTVKQALTKPVRHHGQSRDGIDNCDNAAVAYF